MIGRALATLALALVVAPGCGTPNQSQSEDDLDDVAAEIQALSDYQEQIPFAAVDYGTSNRCTNLQDLGCETYPLMGNVTCRMYCMDCEVCQTWWGINFCHTERQCTCRAC